MRFFVLVLLFCFFFVSLKGQNRKLDSLKTILRKAERNSKVDILLKISALEQEKKADTALFYSQKALQLALDLKYAKGIFESYYHIGNYFASKNYHEKALEYYKEAYKIKLGSEKEPFRLLLTAMINVCVKDNQIGEALSFSTEKLQLVRQLNNLKLLNQSLNETAMLFAQANDFKKAKKLLYECIRLDSIGKDEAAYAMSVSNLGVVFFKDDHLEEALSHYRKALSILRELDNKVVLGSIYSNMGEVYRELGDNFSALSFFSDALQIARENHDSYGLMINYRRIANIHFLEKQLAIALEKETKALEIAQKNGFKSDLDEIYYSLSRIYEQTGEVAQALTYMRLYAEHQAKLFEENKIALATENEMKEELLARDKQVTLLTSNNQENEQKIKQEERALYSLSVLIGLSLILAVVLYRQNRLKHRANAILVEQKKEITLQKQVLEALNEETHKQKHEIELQHDSIQEQHSILLAQKFEIEKKKTELENAYNDINQSNYELEATVSALNNSNISLEHSNQQVRSSIQYAKRIQEALLPDVEQLKKHFPESFVLFRPRDMVSGDFYWFDYVEGTVKTDSFEEEGGYGFMPIQQGRSGKAIIAAIDCTGHGVPGAFMSLLGESYLAQIVHHLEETNPSRILTLLNQRIRKALKQEGGQSRDGMDAALCTWDADERKLYFSGAKNPLIMIQNGELLQIKGDKMCIGGKVTPAEHRYEAHEFDIKTETMCYLFSDGYPDQFGGANAQKFLIKRFKELLLTIHHLPCQEQFDILNTTFQAWVEGHKQTDDVLVIGFRLMP